MILGKSRRWYYPLVSLAALLSCRGDIRDGGFDPNQSLTQVFLVPSNVTIAAGEVFRFDIYGINSLGDSVSVALDWVADGGTLAAGGSFSAASVGTFQVVARSRFYPHPADTATVIVTGPAVTLTDIVITPISPILAPGEARPFIAEAHFSDSSIAMASVNWTATGGTIDQQGTFTAGPTNGTFSVVAASTTDPVADTVPVTIDNIAPPSVTSVVLTPDTVTLTPGGKQQFQAFANYSDGTFAPALVTYTVTSGTITPSGLYTAGQTPGAYRVIARHAVSNKADTSEVIVSPSSLVRIILSPSTIALVTGSKQQFTVAGKFSDSSTAPVPVTFTATGGTVSPSGLYTAGNVAGSFNLFATTTNGLFADTATVQISASNIVLQQVRLRPSTAAILVGATQQFTTTGVFSDGSQIALTPAYTVTGGSITNAGLYTAPLVAGTYSIIARAGNLADTSSVTVTALSTLAGISVSPATSVLLVGAIQQFTAVGLLVGGGTTAVTVNWMTTCGSIAANGQYTAPGAPANCKVIGTHQGGTFADTASVDVSNLPPPVSTACTNEPAGMTPVFNHPWDLVPPVSPLKDQFGWNVRSLTEQAKLSIIQDAQAPNSAPNAIAGKFPGGSKGGAAPFGLTRMFGRSTGELYMCIFTMLDTAFTNNGNTGTKFGFFITAYQGGTEGLNHYYNMTNNVGVALQSTHAQLNRNMLSTFSLIGHRGTWVKVEWLLVSNTPGLQDGIARVWANGAQVLDVQNVEYFFPDQIPAFTGITWNPTYGGGLNPVPYTMYQFIDNWYLSIR